MSTTPDTTGSSRGIPPWDVADLPEPKPLSWRNWKSFVGPGIVMMGIQIGGGEWLFGPEVTAKYGGGLMWIATVAIVLQVFYNVECARYAMYCGEPVFTGFMRKFPGPFFWMGFMFLLNSSSFIPGLSTHGAAIIASLWLDRPATEADRQLVTFLAFACLIGVALPVLVGGKVYNVLQAVMSAKVIFVLGFCLFVGVCYVDLASWWNVFSGFLKFGHVPVSNPDGSQILVNAFMYRYDYGEWPVLALANIAVLGAFAGYAGGGGLSNSTYSNFVRDKGWGMGAKVGAIASALGGKNVTLSHVGKVFPLTDENRRKWRGWWRYIMTDQFFIWAPGCFMGMALPALMSLEFSKHSKIEDVSSGWAQVIMTADGLRNAPGLPSVANRVLWVVALLAGLAVMLPSQMSVVDDVSRRWTDAIWTGSRRVRETFKPNQVNLIYYSILAGYLLWSFFLAWWFTVYGSPKTMTVVIANLNNVAIGITSLQLLWINHTLLPRELRPRWYNSAALVASFVCYVGLSCLVFRVQWPQIREVPWIRDVLHSFGG
jgi:hypothetical protein